MISKSAVTLYIGRRLERSAEDIALSRDVVILFHERPRLTTIWTPPNLGSSW
jgi:hypothetical protein